MMNYLPACHHLSGYLCDRIVPIVAAAPQVCPANLDSLTSLLVRDLPSYANRVIQRRRKRTDRIYSSLLAVGKPELTPIAIVSREYPAQFPQSAPAQIFISTVERQYTEVKSADLQQFHWLFVVNTKQGWRLVNIYSRTGSEKRGENTPLTPPAESSQTSIGTAIRLWLNDCQRGRVRG
jgi:hypothetical protein